MQDNQIREFAGADTAYDVAMRRLEEQMRQIDQIDTKVGVTITAASAIVAIFATVCIAALKTASTWPLVTGVVAVVAVGGIYLLLARNALGAYRLYDWSLRPNWDDLIHFGEDAPDALLKSWAAVNCVDSLNENQDGIRKKLERLFRCYRLLEAEAIATLAGILAIILADRLFS